MGEQINNSISRIRACPDYAFNTFQGLLSIATRDIFFHAVENLLDIDPDISGTNRIGFATFQVFCYNAIDFLIIASKDFWDISVFCLDVKDRADLLYSIATPV